MNMTKITQKERETFEEIFKQDMAAIQSKMATQIKDFWTKAREEVLKTKGWDKLIKEKEELKNKIGVCQDRIHELEGDMHEEELKPEQVTELGGSQNEYGKFRSANFHGIPVESQFDYDIVEYIRNHIDLNVPAKFIHDLGRAALRALAMSGSFEEGRKTYEEFYSLDFRKYGVDIPPRLKDVKENIEHLGFTKSTLSLPVNKQGDAKAIENKHRERK